MNVEQLRYFLFTLDEGSFSGAARALSVTTQCVSKAVSNLERELGAPLIRRTGQGALPTSFGEALSHHARMAVRAFDDTAAFAREYMRDAPPSTRGQDELHMVVCAPYFPHMGKVSEGIAALVCKHLGIRAHVSFCLCPECVSTLEHKVADVAIVIGEPDNPKLSLSYLGSVPCGVQVAAESPLARKKKLLLKDVLPYPVCLWPGYDFFNNYVRAAFATRGIDKQATEDATGLFFSQSMRQEVMFVPRLTSLDVNLHDTVPLTFDASEKLAVPIYLATLKEAGTPLGHAAQEALKNVLATL